MSKSVSNIMIVQDRERYRKTFLSCLEAVVCRYRLNVVGKLAAALLLLIHSPDGVTKHVLGQLRHGSTYKTLVKQAACNDIMKLYVSVIL